MLYWPFFDHARLDPGRPALSIGDRQWSYAELAAIATDIGAALAAAALDRAIVAVLSSKTLVAYSAMLGVMAAGCSYVPLNRKVPSERNAAILEDAECAGLIVDQCSHEDAARLLRACRRQLVVLLPDVHTVPPGFLELGSHRYVLLDERRVRSQPELPRSNADPANDAYIIYTSGSTGSPKGVPVRHESICACIESLQRVLHLQPEDRCTQLAELSFDFAIGEIFLCWRARACLCVPSPSESIVPLTFVARSGISVWSSVPTIASELRALRALKPNALGSLRISYFCGEALSASLAQAWAVAAPRSKIVNLYGPTEAAVFSTFFLFEPAARCAHEIVPIGTPLDGIACAIVNETGEPVIGDGEVGELLLTGRQVSDGYWRNPAATAASFIRGAFGAGEPRTWYRTGDLVSRHAPCGFLFHGRKDRQVKVRGYRVELQEVETQVARIIGCDQLAVIPLTLADGRCESLVAACLRLDRPEALLREACRKELPPHLVPERFLQLPELPLNVNGKVDYLHLRRLVDEGAHRTHASEPSWTGR